LNEVFRDKIKPTSNLSLYVHFSKHLVCEIENHSKSTTTNQKTRA
jgi:hypothetical protein